MTRRHGSPHTLGAGRRRSFTMTGQQVVVAPGTRIAAGSSSNTFTNWRVTPGTPQSRLEITAASGGTPSLVVVVEDSPDLVTWTTRDTFPAQTGVATVTRALPTTLVAFQRVSWTITGTTPSFTFSVQFAASTGQLM